MSDTSVEATAREIVEDMWRSPSKEGWVVRIAMAIATHTEAAVKEKEIIYQETYAAHADAYMQQVEEIARLKKEIDSSRRV